jgi:cytochrome c-type biogenesis protein CcmE
MAQKKRGAQDVWSKPVKHHHAAVAIGAVVLLALGSLYAWYVSPESNAANTAFEIRGDVTKLDKGNGVFSMTIRHGGSTAEHYVGSTREINAGKAVFYKYDSKQKKVRTTFGGAIDNTGYEVVVKGTVDDSEVFKANSVTRNDNLVKLRGYVRGQSVSNNTLDIEIDSMVFQATGKAYRSKTFKKGGNVLVHYDEDSTKFKSRDGNAMDEDQVSNNDEKVTIDNIQVRYGSRLEADVKSTIQDGKWLF